MKKGNFNIEKHSGVDNPSFEGDSRSISNGSSKSRHSKGSAATEEESNMDEWEKAMPQMDTGPPWHELSTSQKVKSVVLNTIKIMCVFMLLYFFVCSLDLLSSAFKLISGKATNNLLANDLMSNPIVGLMVGILLTVLLQSSSTSTSIIVSMVSAGMLDVHDSIPIIMGTNVGTSVTNTIVSLTQVGDREVFRRAFAGATVHDMFNWLAVIVLLTIEMLTGLLEKLTGAIVHAVSKGSGGSVEILTVITKPLTNLIVQLDRAVLSCWGIGQMEDVNSMIVEFCKTTPVNSSLLNTTEIYSSTTDVSVSTDNYDPAYCQDDPNEEGVPHSCTFMFYETSLSDSQVGIIVLIMSLFILCGALIIIVKLLNSMLKGSIAIIIKKTLNADVPYVPWITGYLAILIGAVMTFIVQSSSIFTSTLTPLIGIGIITVERAYPLTLGSNIGTTTTALLASLAGEGEGVIDAIQIALVHLFFNVFGILIFYPIPFMRFPIPMCKFLGNVTAKYRWFAVVYLFFMFLIMPLTIFGLSLGGTAVLAGVLGPIVALLVFVGIVSVIQHKKKEWLPRVLQDWKFLPLPLRSLAPYDKAMTSLPCCKKCNNVDEELESRHSTVVMEKRKESQLSDSCSK